jgi:membrane fusion protein
MTQLFRQEAIDAQRDKLLGEVSLARPLPVWVFTAMAAAFATLAIAFALTGEFARRERVEGYVALDAGAARILIPEVGTLAELMVAEGQSVAAGTPIARITFETTRKAATQTSELVQKEIGERIDAITREQREAGSLANQQSEQLRRRMADLQKEIAQIDSEIRLQQQRVASAEQLAKRYSDLTQEKFVSDIVAQQRRDEVLDQTVKLEALRRQRATIERDLGAARAEEPSVSMRARATIEQLKRAQSELEQSRIQEQADAKRETVLRAPFAGTITNVALSQGQSVVAEQLLTTLLPTGSGLHVELLVPTRAIGFVKPGNVVELRYEAFPFQRFGQYRGSVNQVSKTVWNQGEKVGPFTLKEPVYRVDVKLDSQSVRAQGQDFPLKSGMLVGADILLEKRTIFEWVFEPVLQLKARL